MKHSRVFALLILFALLYEAQGINRKLMTGAKSSTITSMNYMNDDKGNPQAEMKSTPDNFTVGSAWEHSKVILPHDQDVIDLAGMDYSPPRRKTPIHN
ncbi:putative Root meristem growth factor 9 [Helianthus anomalus]